MPIQLDKILSDIGDEKTLHPFYPNPNKKEVEDAWVRVGKKNKLSVHETRSIFKVLQKKYEQEKTKNSTWKLFGIMEQIHQKDVIKLEANEEEESTDPVEEDEEYEMIDVQEEEDHATAATTSNTSGTATDSEGSPKLVKNSTSDASENTEKLTTKNANAATLSTPAVAEEKKLLNTMTLNAPRAPLQVTVQTSAAAAAALHKKGITLRKTSVVTTSNSINALRTPSIISNQTTLLKNPSVRAAVNFLEVGKTIQLPESVKRKLSEDQQSTSQQAKKPSTEQQLTSAARSANAADTRSNSVQQPITSQLLQAKQERENQLTNTSHGINFITIPSNPQRTDLTNGVVGNVGGGCSSTAATVASTSTNGFSPRLDEIDFRNDIIFDPNCAAPANNNKMNANTAASDIINLGNFDNSLPRTFFRNLCNSSRHEALGLYVANVMNRLNARSAAKLELGILRAILDVQSDELEQ